METDLEFLCRIVQQGLIGFDNSPVLVRAIAELAKRVEELRSQINKGAAK